MSLDMKQFTIHFDPTKGRKQRESQTVVMSGRVRKAEAALKGFHVGYTDRDHHVYKTEIDLDITRVSGNAVTVAADFLLRDSSGNIDDRFDGFVQGVVIADVG